MLTERYIISISFVEVYLSIHYTVSLYVHKVSDAGEQKYQCVLFGRSNRTRFAKGILLCQKLHHLLQRTSCTHIPVHPLPFLRTARGLILALNPRGCIYFVPHRARALNSERGESPFDYNWKSIEYHAGRKQADIPFHTREPGGKYVI